MRAVSGFLAGPIIGLLFCCCSNVPKTGEFTRINPLSNTQFIVNNKVTSSESGFILTDPNASLSSNFKIRNFELYVRFKTTPGAEGFILFAKPSFEEKTKGYVVQLNNSDYRVGNPLKTGSLNNIRNNFIRTGYDQDWTNLTIKVLGQHILVQVNGKSVSEYREPGNPKRAADLSGHLLGSGYFSIHKTGREGELTIAELAVKPIKDLLPEDTAPVAQPDSLMEVIEQLNATKFPFIDFHGHLKGGLTMDQACQHARDNGYQYGIAANCGLKFPVTSDSTLNAYLNGITHEPVFKVMQCEGREWVNLFTPQAVARFDYIFTDAMTWSDNKGRRMRLWIPEETFVENDQQFMDMLVGKIESIMSHEPVDIYVNPTFLPAQLQQRYDELWTQERMDRVINVLKQNDVALEINARYKIPSIAFLKRAKAAGLKFTFGTNNSSSTDLGRLEYCLKAIHELNLTPDDIFLPRPVHDKKVLTMGLPAKITG